MKHNNLDALVAATNAALLALLGVDYYATIWAFVGSLLALTQMQKMTRPRAVIYVLLSTLIGAALAGGAVAFLGTSHRAFTVTLGLLGGAGSQGLVALLLRGVEGRIKSLLPGEPNQ
jgi:peptidoglycan/LPS O-acetylase OafA/YrhL